jgi:outer membrane immunogenic protein
MRKSKLIISAAVAISAIAAIGAASAADLPARAYSKAPVEVAAVYDWTGFYIGGNVGGAWRSSDAFTFTQPGGTFDPLIISASHNSSIIGGVHAGYNWQASSLVLGLESDFSGTHLNGLVPASPTFVGGVPAAVGVVPITVAASRNIDWLASVRGRIGYAWSSLLLYGTGGVAWAHTATALQMSGGNYSSVNGSVSSTKVGWVAGAGVEYKLTQNWIARAEYLYYGLKGEADSFNCPACVPIPSGNPVVGTWRDPNVQEVRVGLSYMFGGPVVARY